MFNIQPNNALERSLIDATRSHQLNDLWEQCHQQGQTQTASIEISTKDLYLQAIATPLTQALPGHTLLLLQNLTRMRQLETVRRDFISNISHELRTPLASLKALTETLHDSALDDPPAARRFLERMETEVDALSLMVSELLELSRIESGQVPLKMSATPPIQIVSQAIERLALQAERADLEIIIDFPEDLPPILVDPARMEQVLVNLLHNAIKFTSPGGQVTVSAEEQPQEVCVSVSDNGIGISKDALPRIFERFYKADRARSTGGTGLGLAIAKHLVEAHGGNIWAESIEGKGSTFYLTLPKAS